MEYLDQEIRKAKARIEDVAIATYTTTTYVDPVTFEDTVTMQSTMTVGPSTHSLTANYASVIRGGWTIVSSTNPSNATTVTFSGVDPNYTHRLTWRFVQNTSAAVLRVRFNADSGSNYSWAAWRAGDSGGTAVAASASDTEIELAANDVASSAGNPHFGTAYFSKAPNDATVVVVHADNLTVDAGAPVVNRHIAGGRYDGAAALTSVSILPSAGSVTGLLYLEALVPPTGP